MLLKKTAKKIFLSLLAATTILSTSAPSLANKITVTMPKPIHETMQSQHLSSGVTHENILRFTTEGWWNINVLRIRLDDQYTELKGLFSQDGLQKQDKVSTMVEKSGAIGGINGDFFYFRPVAGTLGPLINNGEWITNPLVTAEQPLLPSFYLTNANKGGIEYLNNRMVATNLNTGNEITIEFVNKAYEYFNQVTLFNKNWGSKSVGNKFHADSVEVLVLDNIVQDIRFGGEAFDIPVEDNSYVLAVRGKALEDLSIGNKISLNLSSVPNIDGIKFAIGGGSVILKDGELSLTDINLTGAHPRTGIAINQDQTEVMLVTIDGRDSSFKGVSQEKFGAILKELGAYNALNLDGGGSTTMAIKPINEDKATVVNKPSDGGERKVVNGVGVFSSAPVGELSYLKVTTDDSKMFVDTTRSFQVKGFDEYHNPVDIVESEVLFAVEGVEGVVNGNLFKATSSGKATVTANYNGILGSSNINVLGSIADLTTNLTSFNVDLNGQQKLPSFFGKDKNGTQAKVYLDDIVFNIINGVGEIKDGVFVSGDKAIGGAITALAGNGVENILVSVGSKGVLVEGFESLSNFNFTAYPETVTGSINLNSEARDGVSSISLNYDFSQGDNTRAAYVNFAPNGLTLSGLPKKLGLWVKGDGNGAWLRATVKDKAGQSHTIDFSKTVDYMDWQYKTANIPTSVVYPIILEKIYIAEVDSLKKPRGEILLDGLTSFSPSPIGNLVLPTPTSLKDDLAKKTLVEKDGFSFIVATAPENLNDLVGYDASSKIVSKIAGHNLGVMLKGYTNTIKEQLPNKPLIDATKAYSITKHNDLILFKLDTSKGGIRATESSQWISFIKDLETRSEKNFAIFLPTPIFGSSGFSDALEANLLHNKLVEAREKGKNIFVIHGGSGTKSDLIDGIRYIQLNTKPIVNADDIYDISTVEFVINSEDISYEINNVFQRPKITVKK